MHAKAGGSDGHNAARQAPSRQPHPTATGGHHPALGVLTAEPALTSSVPAVVRGNACRSTPHLTHRQPSRSTDDYEPKQPTRRQAQRRRAEAESIDSTRNAPEPELAQQDSEPAVGSWAREQPTEEVGCSGPLRALLWPRRRGRRGASRGAALVRWVTDLERRMPRTDAGRRGTFRPRLKALSEADLPDTGDGATSGPTILSLHGCQEARGAGRFAARPQALCPTSHSLQHAAVAARPTQGRDSTRHARTFWGMAGAFRLCAAHSRPMVCFYVVATVPGPADSDATLDPAAVG